MTSKTRMKTIGGWMAGTAFLFAAAGADAKSLYLIANINASPTPIETYDIQGAPNQLVLQATQGIPSRAGGAVGLAIDTDNRKLFTTYEGSNVIQLVDATNFADLGTTTAPGASNLAGLVVDQGKKKLYAVDRGTNHLYVYSWDSATNTLTLDGGAFVALAGVSSAHGLALDEARGRLYVGDNASTTVRYYSTSGWGIAGSFALTTTAQTPMGIAVDSSRNVVYMGNAYGPYGSLGQLVKFDLKTNTESVYTLPGASAGSSSGDNILGVAVDEDTGYVYATTGNQGSGGTDTVMVFNQNLAVLKEMGDLGDPTGLAIPRASISFNPLDFTKGAAPSPVTSGANLTYQLCYDNLANEGAVNSVSITDAVPAGTTFVSASGSGTLAAGVVTWTIGTVAGAAPQACESLVVAVNAAAGATIFNSATITGTIGSQAVPTTQTVSTDVIGGYKPLNITMSDSADPVPTGTNVTYHTCVNPGSNNQTVNGVQIVNAIPSGTSFVSASGAGSFDGTAVTWSLGNLAPETADVCVDLVLAVSAVPGTQLTNAATISSANTSPVNVTHATDVTSNYAPLGISYDDGIDTVPSGSELTLHVCYDNLANTLAVNNVLLKGPMPDGTTYVSSTGGGVFDGTYVSWDIGTLAAGAAQACKDLTVMVVALPGDAIVGGMVLSSADAVPSSSAIHSTAVVDPVQHVTVTGKGEGGGGSFGLFEVLFGGIAAGVAGLRRRRGKALARAAVIGVSIASAAASAQAAGPGWYAGLGIGQVNGNASTGQFRAELEAQGHSITSVTVDDTDTGGKAFAGYRINPYFAVEGSYVDLGKVKSIVTADVLTPDTLVADVARYHPISITGFALAGVASWPIGDVSIFGKAGVVGWKATATAQVAAGGTGSASSDASGTDVTYGLGVAYDFPQSAWSVRAEWERFQTSRNDPSFMSISVMYRF